MSQNSQKGLCHSRESGNPENFGGLLIFIILILFVCNKMYKEKAVLDEKIKESIKNQEIIKQKIIENEKNIGEGQKKIEEIHTNINNMSKDEFVQYLKDKK